GQSLFCRWLYLLFLKFQSYSYFVTSSSSFRSSTFQNLLSRARFWIIHRGWFPDDAARAQAFDFFRVEPEFSENFVVVFAKIGRALRRYFRDAVHLNRTADSELYVLSGAFQRNDDVVGL